MMEWWIASVHRWAAGDAEEDTEVLDRYAPIKPHFAVI